VVVALLAALGVWFDAAGPVGDLLTWMLRGSLGVVAVAFPIVGVYWGTLLLRDTAREDRVRMFIGFSVLSRGRAMATTRSPWPAACWARSSRTR